MQACGGVAYMFQQHCQRRRAYSCLKCGHCFITTDPDLLRPGEDADVRATDWRPSVQWVSIVSARQEAGNKYRETVT